MNPKIVALEKRVSRLEKILNSKHFIASRSGSCKYCQKYTVLNSERFCEECWW